MDDMKKLIEKYKQELMAYRRAAETEPKNISFTYRPEEAPATRSKLPARTERASDSAAPEPRETPRKPQIIGYADEGEASELYRELFGGEGTPDGDVTHAMEASHAEKEPLAENAPHAENTHRAESAPPDPAPSPDMSDIFSFAGEENAENADSAESAENPQKPELPPEGLIAEPEELFAPQFNEVPSFGEVQSKITADSRPEDNTLPREPVSGVTSSAPTDPLPEAAQAQRVSPETAERLTEQPVSGTDPDEQLTGRSFESDERPVNDPADIKPNGNGAPAVNYEERAYSSYAEFERENTRTGQLRFRTFTARGALPVKDAVCVVTKDFGGETQVLSTQTTDMSGQTDIISLPAPPRSLSQTPNNTILPYALYDASIRAKGFESIVLKNIPIFEGILSVQNSALIPLAPNENEGNFGETIDEAAVSGGERNAAE